MTDDRNLQALEENRLSTKLENKKAMIVGVYFSTKEKDLCVKHLAELGSLCNTYGIDDIVDISCPIKKIDFSTYVGKGKIEEIRKICEEENIELIIFDDEIKPQQQRNLEKSLKKTIIDRTELILGVFAQRAKTKEAKLQIELAQCQYQMPRLKRLWTHLSRQHVGGASGGYLKGMGERQIEIDRRLLRNRIAKLQNKINQVKKHRDRQRSQRKKTNIPIFAIIGYTNVGKSTLLKALTNADILIEDKLFATLDTTTRKFTLPNNQDILLVDTVGFIRKIPHTLVASFKSTLEEASYGDILLHLVDVSDPQIEEQTEESLKVLKELNAENKPIITVFNKIDDCFDKLLITKLKIKYPKTVEISALKKQGFKELLDMMIKEIALLRKVVKLKIPQNHYALVSKIIREGRIISQNYEDNYILLEAEIPQSLEKKIDAFIVI